LTFQKYLSLTIEITSEITKYFDFLWFSCFFFLSISYMFLKLSKNLHTIAWTNKYTILVSELNCIIVYNSIIEYQNLWDTLKEFLKGNFLAISAFIKRTERSQNNDLMLYLKLLEKQEQENPKTSRRREIKK
jgi:hypothetical protein